MEKSLRKPNLSISRRRIRRQDEWKVEIHMESAASPTRVLTRDFISAAALLVKVMAKMLQGATFLASKRYAIRWVTVLVLPEPAPAKISSGPSVVMHASYCLSFNKFL